MHETTSDVISPDGTILVEFDVDEFRASHWVYSPRITDVKSKEVLLDLWGTPWDGVVSFGGNGEVILRLRRYPNGNLIFIVHIDQQVKTFFFEDVYKGVRAQAMERQQVKTFFEDLPDRRQPLSKFNQRLEEIHRIYARYGTHS